MDIKFRYLPDSPPVFDTEKARARFAAAKADYLAGGSGPEVCERHGISLRTFRWRAKTEGWRRADQPAPALAPDTAPAPAAQDDPLVIPDAPTGAIRDGTQAPSGTAAPLTAARMVDRCWSHVQAAVAAGHLIQARGWLRLYKELKPFARYEEIEAREARMERDAADRRAADTAAEEEPLVIPDAPSGAIRDADLALPLHCFSASESHAPPPAHDDPPGGPDGDDDPDPLPAKDLARLIAQLKAVTARAEAALHDEAVRLPLHCFSRPESHHPGQGP